MKLGVVGEDPSDSSSLINLLSNYYGVNKHQFVTLVYELVGDQLNTKKARKLIKIAYLNESPEHVLYTRDLDALSNDTAKIKEREKEFEALQPEINNTGVLLLNIYELETLILADIFSFNGHYGAKLGSYPKPMSIAEPKEELKVKTSTLERGYYEGHNPEVFAILNPEVVKENCKYFRDFLAELKQLNIN